MDDSNSRMHFVPHKFFNLKHKFEMTGHEGIMLMDAPLLQNQNVEQEQKELPVPAESIEERLDGALRNLPGVDDSNPILNLTGFVQNELSREVIFRFDAEIEEKEFTRLEVVFHGENGELSVAVVESCENSERGRKNAKKKVCKLLIGRLKNREFLRSILTRT
jgi:hypothetical protein